MLRSDFGSALVSGAQKSGALELVAIEVLKSHLKSLLTYYFPSDMYQCLLEPCLLLA